MILQILAFLERVLVLIKELSPSAFQKKEAAKKDADKEGQSFWEDRNL